MGMKQIDSETRAAVVELATQLSAVKAGKGFFNVARLRKMGLIAEKKEMLHNQTYSIPTGRTLFFLTAKGNQMLTASAQLLAS